MVHCRLLCFHVCFALLSTNEILIGEKSCATVCIQSLREIFAELIQCIVSLYTATEYALMQEDSRESISIDSERDEEKNI